MKCTGCEKNVGKECVYCKSEYDKNFQIFCCDGVSHPCCEGCLVSFVREEYQIIEVDLK